MDRYRYLIIGGGIAGTTAAEHLRKRDPEGTIAIVSDEPHRLYSRVLLSKPAFLKSVQPFDSVWMKTPEWYDEEHIVFLGGTRATELDPEKHTVTLASGGTLGYEKLLLATGTHARPWNIPGAGKRGVHYLRTLDDAKGIIEDLRDGAAARAVMIGSACVTYEVADILISKGISVTEVMREDYFWQPALSREEAALVEGRLTENNIDMVRAMEVAEVLGGDRVSGVRLKDGREIECDMVFAFIGVVQPTEWLVSSGIALDRGIIANEHLETSLPGVYAAGDCARFKDVILDDTVMMGNWMNAVKQGEVAAENMTGAHTHFTLVSFHSSHGFGDMISFAGDVRTGEDRTFVFRGNTAERKLGRLILRGDRVVGATMVNRASELSAIVRLIAERTDISGRHTELADGNFDLKGLL